MNKVAKDVKKVKQAYKEQQKGVEKQLNDFHNKPKCDNVVNETESKIKAVEYYNSLSEYQKKEFNRELQKKRVREHYLDYLKYIYGDMYKVTRFHTLIAKVCESIVRKVENGEQVRVLLSVEPQVGKSLTITEALPSWFLMRNPDLSCILTAYNADIAEKFGDRNRQKIKDFGKELFGIEISDSQDNKTLFQIKKHQGQCVSAGILGALTSNPSALTIIDDPFKNGFEASNPELREKVYGVYQDSILTRTRGLGGAILVVHTRWHEDDLIGRLCKQEGWIYINIPCVWEKGIDKYLGRKIGETACPELGHTAEWAEKMRVAIGSKNFNALYQGTPFIEGGNIVQRKDIKWYNLRNKPESFEEITLSCDLSFGETKKENDPCCMTVWGRIGGDHYLLSVVNKRLTFTETLERIRYICGKYPTMRKKLVEKKANGNATIEMLNQRIGGFIAFDPKGDSKETRLRLVAPYFEAGNIYFPCEEIEPNIEDYVNQLLKFPNATNDDFVDTCSQYLLNYSYKYDNGKVQTDSRFATISKAIRGFRV